MGSGMVLECPGIYGVFSARFSSRAELGLCLPAEVYVHCVLLSAGNHQDAYK